MLENSELPFSFREADGVLEAADGDSYHFHPQCALPKSSHLLEISLQLDLSSKTVLAFEDTWD